MQILNERKRLKFPVISLITKNIRHFYFYNSRLDEFNSIRNLKKLTKGCISKTCPYCKFESLHFSSEIGTGTFRNKRYCDYWKRGLDCQFVKPWLKQLLTFHCLDSNRLRSAVTTVTGHRQAMISRSLFAFHNRLGAAWSELLPHMADWSIVNRMAAPSPFPSLVLPILVLCMLFEISANTEVRTM